LQSRQIRRKPGFPQITTLEDFDQEPGRFSFADVADPALAAMMREAGFLGPRPETSAERDTAEAFALADRPLGAGLTRTAIERSTFLYAGVPTS
jgi:hypothetical protein